MNGRSIQRIRLQSRSAYTLLELMLALALLGALMTVAWSLMGTFRDAEQRGWKLSHRIQTIRVAREWLESDMRQLVQKEQVLANVKKSRLSGNSLGFTASIAPSIDPLPFLETLMASSTDGPSMLSKPKEEKEPTASLYSENEANVAQAQQSLWPAETLEVEYKLTPEDSSTSADTPSIQQTDLSPTDLSEVQFSLTRRELMDASAVQSGRNPPGFSSQSNNLADRVLTAQDLYRQNDETSQSSGLAIRDTRLDGLTNVQFQYFDGISWRREWHSDQAGGLPRAIALCFDFPARANMKPPKEKTSRSMSEGGLSDPSDLLASNPIGNGTSFADAALAAEPTAETSSVSESSLTQSATHEVQIVVYVGGQAKAKGDKQSFGTQRKTRARGSFE